MKTKDEYTVAILCSDMSDEEKISYLKILNLIGNYSEEQLIKLENKIYTLNEKPLEEKDRMLYEINNLYNHYKKKNLDLTKVRKLYYALKNISGNSEEIKKVKVKITKLQLENSMNIRFYNSYLDLLEEIKKQNRRNSQRTLLK